MRSLLGARWSGTGLFGRAVIINIPPFDIFGENLGTYAQIKKSFYFWYFQMQPIIEDRIRQDDFEFIQDIWGDWSPRYQADEDMVHIRRRWPIPITCRRRWATTGANSTRPGSAPPSGRASRKRPGAESACSRSCTCTARTTDVTA